MEKISATLQAYNPTSGEYYAERMAVARELLDELLQRPSKNFTMEDLDGEWELVFSTVKHGIFRSSPFFLAVQEAFGNQESSELFFKLHELQVGSGVCHCLTWRFSSGSKVVVGWIQWFINSLTDLTDLKWSFFSGDVLGRLQSGTCGAIHQ